MERIFYGPHRDQVADLYLPAADAPAPLVVVLHGGFWRAKFDREHAQPEARALATLGYAVANLEYRRVGDGGAWPTTFDDVALALDLLPDLIEDAWPGRIDRVHHQSNGHRRCRHR